MPRPAAIAAVLCLAALLASVAVMARKVAAFNQSSSRTLWVLRPVQDRQFLYAGREVSITDSKAGPRELVTVAYGPDRVEIPATIPPNDPALPGLIRHQDWL